MKSLLQYDAVDTPVGRTRTKNNTSTSQENHSSDVHRALLHAQDEVSSG
jgi:hypothetical protein